MIAPLRQSRWDHHRSRETGEDRSRFCARQAIGVSPFINGANDRARVYRINLLCREREREDNDVQTDLRSDLT